MPPPPDDFITRAPHDVAGWVALFEPAHLPVLADTAAALEELRPAEDAVDAHLLAETIGSDPLMTLKLLAHVAQLRRGRDGGDPETVTEALVMLGIAPFFRAFDAQPTIEDRLAAVPDALAGFESVLRRSHRAARFALGFAAHRLDPDAAVIHEAALLHDFAELLLWYRAPALALQLAERQRAEPTRRSSTVQRELLHVELAEVQHALLRQWRLPALLVKITHDARGAAASTQLRNVQLAIRVARHSAHGWDNPALPDDVRDIALLLNLSETATHRMLLQLDG